VALIVAVGCGSLKLGSSGALSYAQGQSLSAGMEAKAILAAFGRPTNTLEQDGKIRGLTYPCEDFSGQVHELRMVFDQEEKLERWTLRGAQGPAPAPEPAPPAHEEPAKPETASEPAVSPS